MVGRIVFWAVRAALVPVGYGIGGYFMYSATIDDKGNNAALGFMAASMFIGSTVVLFILIDCIRDSLRSRRQRR